MASLSPWASAMNIGQDSEEDDDPVQPVITPEEQVEPGAVSRAPATANPVFANLQKLLAQNVGEQNAGVKKQQDWMDKIQSEEDKPQWNLGPLMGLSDRLFGGNSEKSYQAPPTEAEKAKGMFQLQDLVNKSRQPITQDILKQYSSELGAQSKMDALANKLAIAEGNNTRNLAKLGEKQQGDVEKKQTQTFEKTQALLEASRAGGVAQQAEKDIYNADKAKSLANLYGDPNKLSPDLVSLLRQEVGKIAAGGAASMQELNALDPQTLNSKFASVWGAFSNNPTPANASKFIHQYMDYADALRHDGEKVIEDRYGRIIKSRKNKLSDEDSESLEDLYINRFKKQQGKNPPNKPPSKYVPKEKLAAYAEKNKMALPDAVKHLKGAGYAIEGY